MEELIEILHIDNIHFPNMIPIRQNIPVKKLGYPFFETQKALEQVNLCALIRKGDRVGITVGSRGIASIKEILLAIVGMVKKAGGKAFIIPSMGSHGGGTVEGQIEVLRSLGIDEQSMGIPILASSESEKIGITGKGIPVYVNKAAIMNIHKLIIFNRVKSHTEFDGGIESGICKMCAVGLGNSKGAKIVHEYALDMGYESTIIDVALYIIENLPILCAIGIVENYFHEVSHIKAILPDKIIKEERRLLEIAKQNTGHIPFDKLDLLIIEEIGKNISGAGMDTNLIGRRMVYGQAEPEKPDIKRIVVLDITDESYGNAIGIGLADYTVERVLKKMSRKSTYLNCITAQTPEKGRFPIWFNTDRVAIGAALLSIGSIQPEKARVVQVKNTEEVRYLRISESLLGETKKRKDLEIIGKSVPMEFDQAGNLKKIQT